MQAQKLGEAGSGTMAVLESMLLVGDVGAVIKVGAVRSLSPSGAVRSLSPGHVVVCDRVSWQSMSESVEADSPCSSQLSAWV